MTASITQLNRNNIKDAEIVLSKLGSDVTLDAIAPPVAPVDFDGQLATSMADAISDTDGVNKQVMTAAIAAARVGGFTFKGTIDCSGNPNYPAAVIGDVYRVSVAGKIGGASGVAVDVDDTIYCTVDNAGGTQASVGADFDIVEHNLDGVVIGPASATDNTLCAFDGVTGKLIKGYAFSISNAAVDTSTTRAATSGAVKTYVDTGLSTKVTGPASAVSGRVPSFSGTTGKLVADSGLLAADIVVGPASVTDLNLAMFDGDTGKLLKDSAVALSLDGSMSANSDNLVPVQSAIVTYVTGLIPAEELEVPTGTIDGSNPTFMLSQTPVAGTLMLYLNGMLTSEGDDYALSGTTITFVTAAIPLTESKLKANYKY